MPSPQPFLPRVPMRLSLRTRRALFVSGILERSAFSARGAAIGQSLDIIIPERLRKRHWEGYHHVIKSGESRYGHGDVLAVPEIKENGAGFSIEFTIVPLRRRAHRVGSDYARRYKALRGDARTEAKARGRDEALPLTAWPFRRYRAWRAHSSLLDTRRARSRSSWTC
jgi:hypothetical protein